MILVTGAGGFIGSQVCQLLSARGKSVLAVDRRFGELLDVRGAQKELGDLRSTDFLSAFFRSILLIPSFTWLVY